MLNEIDQFHVEDNKRVSLPASNIDCSLDVTE